MSEYDPTIVNPSSFFGSIHLEISKTNETLVHQSEFIEHTGYFQKPVMVFDHAFKKSSEYGGISGQTVPETGFNSIRSDQENVNDLFRKRFDGGQREFSPEAE